MPITLALEKQRQKAHEFKAILGYIVTQNNQKGKKIITIQYMSFFLNCLRVNCRPFYP
jgi:hypothetical protein